MFTPLNIANRFLDQLSTLPYFRGKGALALLVLRAFPRETLTARLPYGGRMLLGLDIVRQSILPYWIGKYEPEVVQVFCKYLTELDSNDSVLDIGANIGFYTVIAAGCLRERGGGRVHCFEPNPQIFSELAHNITLNHFSNVVLQCQAVGDTNSEKTLYVNEKAITYSSLRRTQEFLTQEIQIPVTMLDTYLETPPREKVGLIKMDVEGAELLVLRGARGLLERDQPILLYEEFERSYQSFGYSTFAVRDFLHSLNYRLFALDANTRDKNFLRAVQDDDIGEAAYQNVLALPLRRT